MSKKKLSVERKIVLAIKELREAMSFEKDRDGLPISPVENALKLLEGITLGDLE